MVSVRILLPIFPMNGKKIYFRGHIAISEQSLVTIYVTKFSTRNIFKEVEKSKDCMIYGYYTEQPPNRRRNSIYPNYLVLCKTSTLQINRLIIQGSDIDTNNSIIMLYIYNTVCYSETLCDNDDNFAKLQKLIQNDNLESEIKPQNIQFFKYSSWLTSSMFVQHITNCLNLMIWLYTTVRRKEKITTKQGNLLLAVIMDIILGYLILELIISDKENVGATLLGILEKLVNLMSSLLKWLMGSPAGLKLNNAFNKMLGKYFSYHVELWWLFLDVTGEKIYAILHIYQYLGYLGITFQAAIISDMICLATFHSYCIYVYAARLFYIQVSGLGALLRLFVGRKYNPLRGDVDSCEYTNQELFVGTVAFTILLLLLPTTIMYYIVFTMFRILSLVVQYVLAKLIYLVQTLPLYVITLWLLRSSKVAGNVSLEVIDNGKSSPLLIKVRISNKSIQELVQKLKPPVEMPKQFDWTKIISNVLTGKQII